MPNSFHFIKKTETILTMYLINTLRKKMKFSIKGFFSKCDQIGRKLQIWSHLLRKFLMVNFIFCAVIYQIHLEKDLIYVM